MGFHPPHPQPFPSNIFPNPRVSTYVSLTFQTCNPNSTLGLRCIIPWIVNTVAPGNIFSSPRTGLSRQNSHYATGVNITTSTFGHPFPSTLNVPTIAVLKWPSSKNGNHDSTTLHLSVLPPTQRHPQKTSNEHERPIWSGHAVASR